MARMCTEFCSLQHHFLNHPHLLKNIYTCYTFFPYTLNTPQDVEGGRGVVFKYTVVGFKYPITPPGKGTQKGSRKKILHSTKFSGTVRFIPVNPGAKIWTRFLLHQN
jgi:hypothetical protein